MLGLGPTVRVARDTLGPEKRLADCLPWLEPDLDIAHQGCWVSGRERTFREQIAGDANNALWIMHVD